MKYVKPISVTSALKKAGIHKQAGDWDEGFTVHAIDRINVPVPAGERRLSYRIAPDSRIAVRYHTSTGSWDESRERRALRQADTDAKFQQVVNALTEAGFKVADVDFKARRLVVEQK